MSKGDKKGTIFHSSHKSKLKYAQTCLFNLPPESAQVHDIVSKGGKRRSELSLIMQNPIMSMHKQIQSKVTYLLDSIKCVKEVKEGMKLSLITQMGMHKSDHSKAAYLLSAPVHNTASQ